MQVASGVRVESRVRVESGAHVASGVCVEETWAAYLPKKADEGCDEGLLAVGRLCFFTTPLLLQKLHKHTHTRCEGEVGRAV